MESWDDLGVSLPSRKGGVDGSGHFYRGGQPVRVLPQTQGLALHALPPQDLRVCHARIFTRIFSSENKNKNKKLVKIFRNFIA